MASKHFRAELLMLRSNSRTYHDKYSLNGHSCKHSLLMQFEDLSCHMQDVYLGDGHCTEVAFEVGQAGG